MESVLNLINDYKSIALSDADLLDKMQHQANLVTYPEIAEYRTLDELLGPYNVCFILYLWKPGMGHWCCITRHGNLVEFFDPYGEPIDSCLEQIPEPYRTESGQKLPMLSYLMRESKYKLSYNEYQFQELDEDVSSCGRWTILRGLLKDLTLEQFRKLFLDEHGDDIATLLTM